MIESPLIPVTLIQELIAEAMAAATAEKSRKSILRVLTVRFGSLPTDIASALQNMRDEAKLDELIDLAATCCSLEEFRSRLLLR